MGLTLGSLVCEAAVDENEVDPDRCSGRDVVRDDAAHRCIRSCGSLHDCGRTGDLPGQHVPARDSRPAGRRNAEQRLSLCRRKGYPAAATASTRTGCRASPPRIQIAQPLARVGGRTALHHRRHVDRRSSSQDRSARSYRSAIDGFGQATEARCSATVGLSTGRRRSANDDDADGQRRDGAACRAKGDPIARTRKRL